MLDLIYNEVWGDAKRSYDYEKGIRNVKIEDVKKLADFKDYSFMALVPE